MVCSKWEEHGPSAKDEYLESKDCEREIEHQLFFETAMDYNFDREKIINENEIDGWQHEHLHPEMPGLITTTIKKPPPAADKFESVSAHSPC